MKTLFPPLLFLLVLVARGSEPAWWTDVNLLAGTPNDTAIALQGQAKYVAEKAGDYIDQRYATFGGAGSEIASMIQGFTTEHNDKVLQLGQLKYISAKFYDRFDELGIDTSAITGTHKYPWTDITSDDKDYAVALLGQLKYVFSFELPEASSLDLDGDGLPDRWEERHIGDADLGDANGDIDGDLLSNLVEYQLGTNPSIVDTDGDGVIDGLEVKWGLNPALNDQTQSLSLVGDSYQWSTDFEQTQGYAVGDLDGQNEWEGIGDIDIDTATPYSGTQSMRLHNNVNEPLRAYKYVNGSSHKNIWVSFAAKLKAGNPYSYDLDDNPASAVFQVLDTGKLGYYHSGYDAWIETDYLINPTNYYVFDLKLNYTKKTWDIYIDNELIAFNIPFVSKVLPNFTRIEVLATQGTDDGNWARLDKVLISTEQPANIELDPDQDFLDSYTEVEAGTDPLNPDTDGDGLLDGWEYVNGLDPLVDQGTSYPNYDHLVHLGATRFYELGDPAIANYAAELNIPSDSLLTADDLTFFWNVHRQPDGANVTFADRTSLNPGITITEPGMYFLAFITSVDGTNTIRNFITFFVYPIGAFDAERLIGYWDFNEISDGLILDRSGFENDGDNLNGYPEIQEGEGWDDLAGEFNGLNTTSASYAQVDGGQVILNGLEELTVMAWIKSDTDNTDLGIVNGSSPKEVQDVEDLFGIRYTTEGINGDTHNLISARIPTEGGFWLYESPSDTSIEDEWLHVAVIWKMGEGIQMYLNGVLCNGVQVRAPENYTNGLVYGLQKLFIGQGPYDWKAWDGKIDEFRIYGKALTAESIQKKFEDLDNDGLTDTWEKLIISDNPSDALASVYDVDPHDNYDGDDYLNIDEHQFGLNPTLSDLDFHNGIINGVGSEEWTTVELPYEFDNMVVVSTPVYLARNRPAVTRIRNASGRQFQIKVQEPPSDLPAVHGGESAWYQMNNSAQDASGNWESLSLFSGLNYTVDCIEGSHSMVFNGENDYASTTKHFKEPRTGNFAISGWFRPNSGDEQLPIIDNIGDGRMVRRNHISSINYTDQYGTSIYGGYALADIHNGDWAYYHNMDFSYGTNFMLFRMSIGVGGTLEIRKNSTTGELLGTLDIPNSCDWCWKTLGTYITPQTGQHDIYLVFKSPNPGMVFGIYWIEMYDYDEDYQDGYRLSSSGSDIQFTLRKGNSKISVSSGGVIPNTWNFYAVNLDRYGNMDLYLNGTDVVDSADIHAWRDEDLSGNEIVLGHAFAEGLPRYWDGSLDDIRFFTRQLEIPEIQRIYNDPNAGSIGDFSHHPLTNYSVHYTAMEAGTYNVATHGFKGEAGVINSTVTDSANNFIGQNITFSQTYSSPVVVGQVMTENDPKFSTFWSGDPSSGNAIIGKHVGEDPDTTRSDEAISYIVLEHGNGTMGSIPFYAVNSSDTIRGPQNSPPYSIPVSGIQNPGNAILSPKGNDDIDGHWTVLSGINAVHTDSIDVFVDEDQITDSEREHTTEQIGAVISELSPDLLESDKDLDGLPDFWERQIIVFDTNDSIVNFDQVLPDDDYDGDGLINRLEYVVNTNPCDVDSDDDGFSDSVEYFAQTSPLEQSEYPTFLASGDPLTLGNLLLVSMGEIDPVFAAKVDSEHRLASVGKGLSSEDQFGGTALQLSGDFCADIRIKDFTQTDPELDHAEVGLMIREDLDPNSSLSAVSYTMNHEYYFMNRKYNNWNVERTRSYGNESPAPDAYLRLKKEGNRIRAYRSTDYITWFEAGEAVHEYEGSYQMMLYLHGSDDQRVALASVQMLRFERDTDQDGLDDATEVTLGTEPYVADSDGDGLSDGLEVELGTDPNDATSIFVEATISPDLLTYSSSVGNWTVDDNALYTYDIRGSVDYTISVINPGIYRLHLGLSQKTDYDSNDYRIAVFLDGEQVDEKSIELSNLTIGELVFNIPYLSSGSHNLSIQWTDGEPDTALQLNSLELKRLAGDDDDSDGVADWIEEYVAATTDLDETSVSSAVSPYCLEGESSYLTNLTINAHKLSDPQVLISPAPTPSSSILNRYYANVPLFETETTVIAVEDQGGLAAFSKNVTWTPTTIQNGIEKTIRVGDSILFQVSENDLWTLNIRNASDLALLDSYSLDEGERKSYRFTGIQGETAITDYLVEALVEQPVVNTPTNTLTWQKWLGVEGERVSDLTSFSAFPDSPDAVGEISNFELPSNWGTNFGVRIQGYLIVPVTGVYRFWLASNNRSQLWLSSDSSSGNLVQIASVPDWTYPEEWDKYSGQQSSDVSLVAGEWYFIEGLFKEAGKDDNFAVAWQGPGITRQVIPGSALSNVGSYQTSLPDIEYTMSISAVSIDLGNNEPATIMGFSREWTPSSVPEEVVFETDSTLNLEEIIPQQDPRNYKLSIGSTRPQAIVARLDSDDDGQAETGEPIVAVTFAHAISQDLQRQSRMTVIAINNDGSIMVQASLHLDYVPDDLEIAIDIVRGGVLFDDGATTRIVTSGDFDAMGNYTYLMQMVGVIEGGLCHEVQIRQGSSIIAE